MPLTHLKHDFKIVARLFWPSDEPRWGESRGREREIERERAKERERERERERKNEKRIVMELVQMT